jgi:hypothetical protein
MCPGRAYSLPLWLDRSLAVPDFAPRTCCHGDEGIRGSGVESRTDERPARRDCLSRHPPLLFVFWSSRSTTGEGPDRPIAHSLALRDDSCQALLTISLSFVPSWTVSGPVRGDALRDARRPRRLGCPVFPASPSSVAACLSHMKSRITLPRCDTQLSPVYGTLRVTMAQGSGFTLRAQLV